MFEGSKPIPAAQDARFSGESGIGDALIGSADVQPYKKGSDDSEQGGGALRMLEWSELSARLSASRDLRQLLRRDASRQINGDSSSFADAAAQYFRTRGEGGDNCEPGVNPVALERCKGSPGTLPIEIAQIGIETEKQTSRGLQDEEADDPGETATGPNNGPLTGRKTGPDAGDAREDK